MSPGSHHFFHVDFKMILMLMNLLSVCMGSKLSSVFIFVRTNMHLEPTEFLLLKEQRQMVNSRVKVPACTPSPCTDAPAKSNLLAMTCELHLTLHFYSSFFKVHSYTPFHVFSHSFCEVVQAGNYLHPFCSL